MILLKVFHFERSKNRIKLIDQLNYFVIVSMTTFFFDYTILYRNKEKLGYQNNPVQLKQDLP